MFFLEIPLFNTNSYQSRNKDGKKTAKGRQKDGNETKEKAAKKQCPFGDACAPACKKKCFFWGKRCVFCFFWG